MKFRKREADNGAPGIPTSSMGDIAFLIIIFFMATSIFSREKGLKIVLPEKGEEVKIKSENIMNVSVSPAGKVLIGEEVVEIPAVRQIVVERLQGNPELAIGLRVSRNAPYHVMIDVFDQLKMAQAQRISLIPIVDEGGEL